MMQKIGVNFQPLQHVLLDYYFEHSGKTNEFLPAVSRLHSRIKCTCPSPYAVHGDAHEIDRVVMLKGPDGSPVGSATGCWVQTLFFSGASLVYINHRFWIRVWYRLYWLSLRLTTNAL
jgi:hypothetical protein